MPLQVRLRKSYARKAGYSRYSGVGKLIKPVENQEGRWYVKFVNLGETFLSVGRHGVHELAYVDMAPLNMLKEKNKIPDLAEAGKDEDDTSVCHSPPSPAPPSPRKAGSGFSPHLHCHFHCHCRAVCDCATSTGNTFTCAC